MIYRIQDNIVNKWKQRDQKLVKVNKIQTCLK